MLKEKVELKEEKENLNEQKELKQNNFFEKYSIFVKKLLVVGSIILLILILVIVRINFFNKPFSEKYISISTCGDGTFYDSCSLRKPFYCKNGTLVENASVCGCSENLTKKEDSCISEYQTEPKNISLEYVLDGEKNKINFTLYKGEADYFNLLSKNIFYNKKKQFTKADLKFEKINNLEQEMLLSALIIKIENLAEKKEDQARIVISIVQNIVYNESNDSMIVFDGGSSTLLKYPYEVLYDNQAVCEGKSELLAFLLKEIGYGSVLFYYPEENHAAVGIKCPMKESNYGSGYCFVETTAPSIITNNKEYYIYNGELTSIPEIFLVSNGISFPEDAPEYKDAKSLIKINKILEKRNFLGRVYQIKLKNLIDKYGLKSYEF